MWDWKVITELMWLTPFVALFIGAFVYETRQAVLVARALRNQNKRGAK